ncbi:hemerythrin domain-containing protein [Virgisporangium aliadipatigenens]|nr:hemerythrin domain-containing protein [Virgisporangium aliadipatigenens]
MTDSYTRCRVSTMEGIETASALFDRRLVQRCRDVESRQSVGRLGESASARRDNIAARKPQLEHPLESAIGSARAALDLVIWVARNEPDRDRRTAYQRQAWSHLAQLQRLVELSDRAGHPWADRVGSEIEELTAMPVPTAQRPGDPGPFGSPPPSTTQPVSLLHRWAVGASRPRRGSEWRTGHGDWGQLVVHESAACYLYYSFMGQETDRRLRQLWELHLQMELANLRAAGDLLRRHTGRDPQEVVGPGLPEPVALAGNALLLWDPAGAAGTHLAGAPGTKPDSEWDVVDRMTEQHHRIEHQFRHTLRVTGDARHSAFGRLARLIAVHETVEEEVVHPLTRRCDPDGHLADHLLDAEHRISDALADAVRADAAGEAAEELRALRDMIRAHARQEEHDEFPRLRRDVPADELCGLTDAVQEAEEAADIRDEEPQSRAGWLPRTADRVRDALRRIRT